MTREEAAHIVDVAFGVPQAVRRIGEDRTYHEDEIREAKNMAIEALEQLTSYERTINKLTKAISEQEPKTGQWLAIGFDGYADGYPVVDLWECSECHEEHYGEEDTLTMYCPNCGARMESEDKE